MLKKKKEKSNNTNKPLTGSVPQKVIFLTSETYW